MKLNLLMLCAALFIFLFSLQAQEIEVQGYPELKPVPGQYIVVLKESAANPVVKQQRPQIQSREQRISTTANLRTNVSARVSQIQQRRNIAKANVIFEYTDVLSGFAARLSDQQVSALRTDPDVAGVYQDYSYALSPIKQEANPRDVNAAAQTVTCAITKAGGFVDGSGKRNFIWILDTGIDLAHPDLNVETSATYARSFVPGETVNDGNGHGTHVAGIAAARNNSIGVVGVSAGARVVPVKVLANSGSGNFSWLISGLNHVAQYDLVGDVVNMSLGGYPVSGCEDFMIPLRDAIRNLGLAGTHVVIAAGNNGDCTGSSKTLPGCINGTRVYTVSSISCTNVCSTFSNFGIPSTDWVAVGQNVYSTWKGGGYVTISGTSMAAPVVAGIIHARGSAPVSGGTVNCCGRAYQIARR